MTALIELEGLGKRFGEVTALREVTASVDGNIIGLLGPNGAGKSTLLKCLLGLMPYHGRAKVLGLEAAVQGGEIRDRVGYMPEQEAFLSGMSAVELCTYAGELSGLPRTEAMQRAHAALYYAGLEEKRYQPIDGYSTGMKQRVKLAQALVHDPEILFLDEPTNGLDPRSRDEMLELIIELPERRGCAIVLSTHLLPDVERICDHAVIMHRGAVRFVGTIDELRGARGRDSELFIEVKSDAARLGEALTAAGATCRVTSPVALQVDLPASATSQLVFVTARAAGLQIRELGVRRESVEAAFLRVLGDAEPARTSMPDSEGAMSAGQIHDLGYKRYGGSRRSVDTRWTVIMRQQLSTAWRSWWRFKIWLVAAMMATAGAAVGLYFASGSMFQMMSGMAGQGIKFADAILPLSTLWYCKVGFIVSLTISATLVAGDVQSGAFTFYFARSVRPRDYVIGKLVGLSALLALIMLVGPVLLAGFRLGLSDDLDQLISLLPVVYKTLAIGVLGTLIYAAVPLGFSALIPNRRHAMGLWAAYYLVIGSMVQLLGMATTPALATLDLSLALQTLSFELFDVRLTDRLNIPASAALISILGHAAAAIALVFWRVRNAQQTGVGGLS